MSVSAHTLHVRMLAFCSCSRSSCLLACLLAAYAQKPNTGRKMILADDLVMRTLVRLLFTDQDRGLTKAEFEAMQI